MRKLLIILSLIIIFIPFTTSANLSVGNGLLGYWPFDIRDGTNTAISYDRSGNGNTASLTSGNPTPPTVVAGKIAQGLSFDPTSSNVIQVPDTVALHNPSVLTLSAWVYEVSNISAAANQLIEWHGENNIDLGNYYLSVGGTECGESSGTYFFAIRTVNNGCGGFSDPGLLNVESTIGPILNKWVLLTGTYDGSNLKLYINGALNNTVSGTGAPFNSAKVIPLQIGGDTGRFTWSGSLDDVRIYNRALSAAEVNQLYRQGEGNHQGSIIADILTTLGL